MRSIRRWLRNLLIRSPSGIGERVLLPKIRFFYDKLPLLLWRTKRYARSEARQILSSISSNPKEYTLVYDTKVTGLAYGTLVNFVSLARFICSHNIIVNLNFVETDLVTHDGTSDKEEINRFIEDSIVFSNAMLSSSSGMAVRISPGKLADDLESIKNVPYVFEDYVKNRRPFFRDCFNVLNYLMASATSYSKNRTLYSPTEFGHFIPDTFAEQRYITWACRYSTKGGDFGRQTLDTEFEVIHSYLTRRFPNCAILVVSDEIGCSHYASVADRLGIVDVQFSKEFSKDFLGDSALIMNSEFFFAFRAGGIMNPPMLSKMPFEMMAPLMNEIPWDKRRLTSWQTDSQSFVVLRKHQFEPNRELDLAKLGFHEQSQRGGIA